jgi:hypothetical protein
MRQHLLTSFIWVHIRYPYDASTSTDLELLQIAKDTIIDQRFIVSHDSEIEPTVDPHLTFKVRGPFQDGIDEQIKAGDLVGSWIQDLVKKVRDFLSSANISSWIPRWRMLIGLLWAGMIRIWLTACLIHLINGMSSLRMTRM